MLNRIDRTAYVCTLGAINGLVFGIVAALAQDMHSAHLLDKTKNYNVVEGMIIDMADPIPLNYGLIILASILTFAGVAQLIHKYWKSPSSLLLLWEVIGAVATIVLIIGVGCIELFGLYHPELNHITLWTILLVFIIIINFIYGFLIQISTELYSRTPN